MKQVLAIDSLRAAVARMPNNGLDDARRAALAQLDAHGLPTTTHEDWKYTDLGPVIEASNQWLAAGARASAVADAEVTAITAQIAARWLVIRNGVVDTTTIEKAEQHDLKIGLLSAAAQAPEFAAPLSGLNVALLRDGLTIQVAAGVEVAGIVGLLFIDSATDEVGVSQARVHIELQAGSSASFIEYHASSGDAAHYSNAVVDVALADSARCDYVRFQDRQAAHHATARLAVSLGDNSRLQHAGFDLGGGLVRNDLDIRLAGRDSAATFHGLYLAGGRQHVDNHTRVDHLAGPSRSQQEYRGILADVARCVWNGKAIVHRGANGSDVNQANHNLLLSATAEINAKPELEIYTDEVKASHGTTIGELDRNALFYLRTRGLNEAAARRLLIRAFAQKIVALSPLTELQEWISDRVAQRVVSLILEEAP